MAIVSSIIFLDNLQSDGRRVIIERHVTDTDEVFELSYMADNQTDVEAKLLLHAAEFDQWPLQA